MTIGRRSILMLALAVVGCGKAETGGGGGANPPPAAPTAEATPANATVTDGTKALAVSVRQIAYSYRFGSTCRPRPSPRRRTGISPCVIGWARRAAAFWA